MPTTLTDRQRTLFALFSRAIYTNPFTPERRKIDCQISGLPQTSSDKTILNKVTSLAAQQIKQLQQSMGSPLKSQTNEPDRQLTANLCLFHAFHRVSDALDNHILAQAEEKNKLIPVKEAAPALELLQTLGFSPEESLHYFALFFQMRRAYFFIQRSLIGSCPSVVQLREKLWNNIFTHDINRYVTLLWKRMEDFSTLLLGGTGTGKSLAAAAIGRSGFIPFTAKSQCFCENFATAFVSRNLSQYSTLLIESELFGHKKGSFTGAVSSHHGIFALCSPYGAIFLDEIGDAAIPIQIKLLQVLQERTFSPVGSVEEKRFSGRVIAATNRPLEEMRRQGTFRNDFYFRLRSDTIRIPSLQTRIREDPEELSLLVSFLLKRIIGRSDDILSTEISGILSKEMGPDYPWPGNVRELEQCIRQVLLNNSCTGSGNDSPEATPPDPLRQAMEAETLSASELTACYCDLLYRRHGNYQEVARKTGLDHRTVKKYLTKAETIPASPMNIQLTNT